MKLHKNRTKPKTMRGFGIVALIISICILIISTFTVIIGIFALILDVLFGWVFNDDSPYWGLNIAAASIIIVVLFVLVLFIFFPR